MRGDDAARMNTRRFRQSAPAVQDDDDRPIGRILTRREIIGLLGSVGAAALLAACGSKDAGPAAADAGETAAPAATPSGDATTAAGTTATARATSPAPATTATATSSPVACIVTPELTEGPFFVDEKLTRSDIRSDPSDNSVRPGQLVALTMIVMRAANNACTPLANATVDVWHCDAAGVYSDVSDGGNNAQGKKFLRGNQLSDALGRVTFTTVYPGWYQGRAVHIHFKVRGTNEAGRTYEFTSQIFFEDAQSERVYASDPYRAKGTGFMRNASDSIFRQTQGKTLVPLTQSGNSLAGTFVIGLTV
jgi:protocatechuate 3,4-dioxygenase beta subunit